MSGTSGWAITEAELNDRRSAVSAELARVTAQRDQARRENAELRAKVARLQAEVDEFRGYNVSLCMDRDTEEVFRQLRDEAAEGDVVQATDTGRRWVFRSFTWMPEE